MADGIYALQLHIENAPPINGWSTTIEYDPTQVRYLGDSFEPGAFIPGLVGLVSEKEGQVSVGGAVLGEQGQNAGSGTLGQLSFAVMVGFSGNADLTVTQILLRPTSGELFQRTVRTVGTIAHGGSPNVLSAISLDFDLAPGDQRLLAVDRVAAGMQYALQLNILDQPDITGWSATIEYDPTQVRYVSGSFQASDFIPGLVSLVDEQRDRVVVGGSVLGREGGQEGTGTLGQLTFEILDEFSGRAEVTVTEIILRLAGGGTRPLPGKSRAVFLGIPDPIISMDFDLAEGNQGQQVQFQVAPGQIHRVQLNIRDAPLISGWSATIEYDPNQVRYVSTSFRPGSFIPGLVALVDENRGAVVFGGAALGTDAANGGSGGLGILSFEILNGFGTFSRLLLTEIILRHADGEIEIIRSFSIASFTSSREGAVTAITLDRDAAGLPAVNRLAQNYPNPFNSYTTLRYQLKQAGLVRLDIFDLAGQRVRTLIHESHEPGFYQAQWDGNNNRGANVSSGMYLARLQVGDFVEVRKLLLVQ